MANGFKIADAYVDVHGDGSKVVPDVASEMASAGGQASSAGASVGSRIVSGLGGVLQGGAAIAVGVAASSLGIAFTKGFGRLTAIDTATAKLSGLGNSAGDVQEIMNNALASVKGTAFGLDEAATTAASAVAAGIKPGAQLTGVLKTVADTATIAGTSMSDMGTIFGSVAARGKLQGDDLMQLQSRGVPVLAFLAKHYGITAQAASDMVSAGEVDFANFSAAMQENLGGAALDSGKTFTGAMSNLFASLGRIGANLMGGVFPSLAPTISSITTSMGGLEDRASSLGGKIAAVVNPALDKLADLVKNGLPSGFSGLGPLIAPATAALAAFGAGGLGGLVEGIPILGKLSPMLSGLGGPFGIVIAAIGALIASSPELRSWFGAALQAIGTALMGAIKQLQPLLPPLVGVFTLLAKTLSGALISALQALTPIIVQVIGFLGPALAAVLPPILQIAKVLLDILGPAIQAFGAWISQSSGWITPLIIILGALAAVIWIVNAAMAANPITLIILGIAALIAIIILLVTNWGTVVQFLTDVWNGFVTWFMGVMDGFFGWWNGVWAGFFGFVTDVWNGFIGWIVGVWSGFIGWITDGLNAMAAWWNGLWAGIGQFVIDTWNGFVNWIIGLFLGYVSWLIATGQGIISWWNGLWSGVASFISGVWNNIVSGAVNTWNGLISWFGGLGASIMGVFNGAISWLADIGHNIVQGLWNGLKSAWNAFMGWWNGVIGGVADVAKKILGIKSPSRVFRYEIGQQIVAGATLGIEDGQDDLVRTVNDVFSVKPDVSAFGNVGFGAGTPKDKGGDSYTFGDVYVNADQLSDMQTAIDTLKGIAQTARQGRGQAAAVHG